MTTATRRKPLPRPTLDQVNAILAYFRGERERRLELALIAGRLWVRDGGRKAVHAAVREDGLWLRYHRAVYRHLGMGGTEEQALVQLVLWYRGRYRKPLAYWNYWCGHMVKLGRPGLMEALVASGYGNPARTCCRLCGHPEPRDWWSRDGVTGPACRHVFDGVCPGKVGT